MNRCSSLKFVNSSNLDNDDTPVINTSNYTSKTLEKKVNKIEMVGTWEGEPLSRGKKLVGMLIFTLAMVMFALNTLLIKITTKKYSLTTQELMYYFNLVTLFFMWLSSRIYK